MTVPTAESLASEPIGATYAFRARTAYRVEIICIVLVKVDRDAWRPGFGKTRDDALAQAAAPSTAVRLTDSSAASWFQNPPASAPVPGITRCVASFG